MSTNVRAATTPDSGVGSDGNILRRGIAAVGLIGIALIHLIDLPDKLEELPYVGVMFIALIIASLAVAGLLIQVDDRLNWMAAGALAGLTLMGYAISRTTGLPGDDGADIGNWTEPLGLASLFTEGIVVLLTLIRITSRPRPAGRTAAGDVAQ